MKSVHPTVRPLLFLILGSLMVFSPRALIADDQASLRVYPAAADEPLSTQFVVKAEDQNVPVYLASVLAMSPQQREKAWLRDFAPGELGQTSFASFDLKGEVHLTVTCPGPINTIKLLPTSAGITPQVAGNSATFTLSKPGQFVLEVNGDVTGCLQIFANPLEADAPDPNDPNVIYFGPGIHKVTSVKVSSGQTVYIAPDAVIYSTPDAAPATPGALSGAVFNLTGDNITLRGRGIIDGSLCPHGVRNMIYAAGKNISIEGVVLRDSGEWNIPLTGCDGVTVRNVKVFGYRGNSDGIDINGSRNVGVSDCYLRTADDLVSIKTKIPGKGPTQHVTVEHCVLWNELATALIVGGEMREPVDDIRFSDCDIIHDRGRSSLLCVVQCDSAHVSNAIFQDIRVEECRRLIFVHIVTAGAFGRDSQRGHIDNVTYQNITSVPPSRPGRPVDLGGIDADHAVHNVKLDQVVIGGQPLTLAQVAQNHFVDGVQVIP